MKLKYGFKDLKSIALSISLVSPGINGHAVIVDATHRQNAACTRHLSRAERVGRYVQTRDDHDAGKAYCEDLYAPKKLTPGYTKKAFVIGCIRKISAGEDPTF